MRTTDRGYAKAVRQVMGVLTENLEDYEDVMHLVPQLAADIIGELKSMPYLIHDGEIWEITGNVLPVPAKSQSATKVWEFTTYGDDDQICRWCPRPYGTSDPGGRHKLCKSCYQEGPPLNV